MRPGKSSAHVIGVLAAAAALLLGGCQKDAFQERIEASKRAGFDAVAEVGEGLPYFTRLRMDPTWDAREPGRLARVESLDLVDHRGARVDASLFRGKPAFVAFIFTTCGGLCPMMVRNLKRIEEQVGPEAGARYVAFSVDPERDTPERLREYAAGVVRPESASRWSFLTGERKEIERLANEVFAIEASKKARGDRIVHSERIFLVDSEGFLRAVLNGTDKRMAGQAKDALARLASPVRVGARD